MSEHTSVDSPLAVVRALRRTVFMGDDTLGLTDALLGLLYDVVWRLVGEADNDGSLGSGGHGGSGEQGGQNGQSSETHFEGFDQVLRRARKRGFYQVVVRWCAVLRTCRLFGKVGYWGQYGVPGSSKPRECVIGAISGRRRW